MSSPIEHTLTFNRLYEKYNRRFIRFAKSYVVENEVAEDIVSDTFMYYWEHKQVVVEQNISAYLLTVIKHKCINYLKHQALEEQAKCSFQSLGEWELRLKISTLEGCEPEKLLSDEIQALVQKALRSMPEQTRNILLRSRYQLQSNKEIAVQLGVSVKAVEYHITRALKILRIVLRDYFPIYLIYLNSSHLD
ncbi:RNA polymerase sigma-70 factor [Bacteroides gallinarum]|uniref:RNA polymerase sigma-70 factor n=1 Tax=Bacteroides gallinarum TaxID=376806 RepID=UPI000373C341|nr:RNA polymerase sigma-70 factor [Bacteroides gallinarum]